MTRPLFVPDASVIIKWYLDEEIHSHKALLLRDRYMLGTLSFMVPDFAYLEVANRLTREAGKDSRIFYELFAMLPHSRSLNQDDLVRAYELASRERKLANSRFTIYDATYIVTAIFDQATLISSDEPQLLAAKRAGCKAVHLKEYQ